MLWRRRGRPGLAFLILLQHGAVFMGCGRNVLEDGRPVVLRGEVDADADVYVAPVGGFGAGVNGARAGEGLMEVGVLGGRALQTHSSSHAHGGHGSYVSRAKDPSAEGISSREGAALDLSSFLEEGKSRVRKRAGESRQAVSSGRRSSEKGGLLQKSQEAGAPAPATSAEKKDDAGRAGYVRFIFLGVLIASVCGVGCILCQ